MVSELGRVWEPIAFDFVAYVSGEPSDDDSGWTIGARLRKGATSVYWHGRPDHGPYYTACIDYRGKSLYGGGAPTPRAAVTAAREELKRVFHLDENEYRRIVDE